MVLEVPVQRSAIPQDILDFARHLEIDIRDELGTLHNQ